MDKPEMLETDRGILDRVKPIEWAIVAGLLAGGVWLGTMQAGQGTLTINQAQTEAQLTSLDARVRALEITAGTTQADIAAIRSAITQGFSQLNYRLDRFEDNRPAAPGNR